MHLFVTGIGGFVGSRLAKLLLAGGEPVSGTYVGAPPDLPGAALYEADLADRGALERALAAAAPDAVVHLAGLAHVGESLNRMAEYFRVNVLGTENLLAAAAATRTAAATTEGAGLRVVLASSAEVYGAVPEDEQPIAEAREVAPSSPYALTKAAAERLALARGAVVMRSFNLAGAGQSRTFALPAFAAQLAAIEVHAAEPVLRVGNLSARRDFLHVDDGAAAYRLLAERGAAGEVYNLASGSAASIGEALHSLMAISGVEARVEIDEARMRRVDLPLLIGDAAKLRALGWAPRRTFDAALADLWREARMAAEPSPAARIPRSK